MQIQDLICADSLALNIDRVENLGEALDLLAELQDKNGCLYSAQDFRDSLQKRADQGAIAIGCGILLPHARDACVQRPGFAAATLRRPLVVEGKPCSLLLCLAAPEDGPLYMELLSRLMTVLLQEPVRQAMAMAKTEEDFFFALRQGESNIAL